jgi:hypothetical protein
MPVAVGRRFLGVAVITADVVVATVRNGCHSELGVVLLAHAGQLLQESYRRPQLLVAVIAPRRHPGHLAGSAAGSGEGRMRLRTWRQGGQASTVSLL